MEIKDELKRTAINITCYDRDGNIITRVTSSDDAEVEDNENENEGGSQTPSGDQTQNQTPSGNQSRQYALNISSANSAQGSVNSSVNKSYTEGSTVNIVATPASGFAFDKWSDGNTQASLTVTMDADKTLVASFKVAQTQGGEDEGGVGEY